MKPLTLVYCCRACGVQVVSPFGTPREMPEICPECFLRAKLANYAGDRFAFERDAEANLSASGLTLGGVGVSTIRLDGGRTLQYRADPYASGPDLSGASCKWGHMPNERGECTVCGHVER